jgi:hypothetical protein
MSDLIERLEIAAQWDDSPSGLIHEAIARITASDEVIKRLTRKVEDQTSAGYCDAQYLSDGPPYRCGWQQRAEALSRTGAVKVRKLEWHEKLKRGERDGFVCSLGGVLAYSIMLSSFRVYGIEGEYDGAAEFETLEAAKAAAQADYENRILAALSRPHPADERVVEALELAEEAEKTAVFWGAEANKAMLQGDHDEAKRCLARAKRHSINAVRLRASKEDKKNG